VELTQLQALADQRDTAALDQITFWDTGAPSYRWNELTVAEALKHNVNSIYGTRALAPLHVGLSDVMVATWNAKYAYRAQSGSTVGNVLEIRLLATAAGRVPDLRPAELPVGHARAGPCASASAASTR
jgi:hypothetical protein